MCLQECCLWNRHRSKEITQWGCPCPRGFEIAHPGSGTSYQAWAVDETEEPYLRDYQEVPQDFSDWCMIASRQGYYADGMMLQALAERLACPIIVFAWDATMQSWVRAVQASKFVDGVAQVDKKGTPPLILLNCDRHYRSLLPEDEHTQMPVSWLLDTEQKPRSFFRGGGEGADDDSMSLSLPSLTPPPFW